MRPRASEATGDALERGRASYAKHAWVDAYESLSHADEVSPLVQEDLERLATSAYMLGHDDDEYVRCLERAHYSISTRARYRELRAVRGGSVSTC